MKNKKIILCIIFIVLSLSQKILAIELRMVPRRLSVCNINYVFSIRIQINTHNTNLQLLSAGIKIIFDPNFLEVTDTFGIPTTKLTENYIFNYVTDNYVDNFGGYIIYSAGSGSGAQPTPVEFVKINFRTKKEGATSIYFDEYSCEINVWNMYTDEVEYKSIMNTRFLFNGSVLGCGFIEAESAGKPFNPKLDGSFKINYTANRNVYYVEVKIYSKEGVLIRRILPVGAGGDIFWDGKDNFGNIVPNGVYIYQIEARGDDGVIYSKPKLIGVFK